MEKKLWFRAKTYGYGWYPATWEGGVITLGFIVLILAPQGALAIIGPENVSGELFAFLYFPYSIILVTALIAICVKKGEKARWRWGK